MAEVFPEVVDRLFCEQSLDVVEAVAQEHHWNVFLHYKSHGPFILRGELFIKVGSGPQEQIDYLPEFFFLESVGLGHF